MKWGTDRTTLSFVNYQPRIRAEHDLAHLEMRQILARNHGFDPADDDSFEEWDSVKSAEMVAKDLFLGFNSALSSLD